MDESTIRILQKLIRQIPAQSLQTMLTKWAHFTRQQIMSLNFKLTKAVLTEDILVLCEENGLTVKHITELEMLYVIDNPNHGMWYAYQFLDAVDETQPTELTQFKKKFKIHLKQLISHVSIKIKKHTDEAVWIRVAWGDSFTRPNHMKPTYVVHHLQTPYVFVSNLTAKHRPLLNQALVLACGYCSVKDAQLSGRKLTSIRDLLMRQYQQVFSTKYQQHPLTENVAPPKNPNIEREQAENAGNRIQMACEAFGSGKVPELQTAIYKLETRFKDRSNQHMTGRDDPFRCVVKFASPNLLESLKHCVSSGMASTPVTPLLSSITQKGRNYFVITDKGLGSSPR
ncbi:centromere protein N [Hypomesus transpacificus]|uniref:centromere protein N n=1 Tax=Hypomesus transpacificus TaxID=137520 RepID=UPI001F08654C|nr:centromere protein N [Hypomesus transpacificus]